jgi:hypothetical protein
MKLNTIDKNNLYHAILQAIKTVPPQQAAEETIMLLEHFMTDKECEALEATDEEGNQVSDGKAKMTGPFRRVGS